MWLIASIFTPTARRQEYGTTLEKRGLQDQFVARPAHALRFKKTVFTLCLPNGVRPKLKEYEGLGTTARKACCIQCRLNCAMKSQLQLTILQINKVMLRQKLKPLTFDPVRKKGNSYEEILKEIQNDGGQDFNAGSRPNQSARVGKQTIKVPNFTRSRN